MSFDYQSEAVAPTKQEAGLHARHVIMLDIGVIGLCLLVGKLLDTAMLTYCIGIYCSFRILFGSIAKSFALLMLLVPNLGIMSIPVAGLTVPILNLLICLALLIQIISCIHEPIPKSYILFIGFFIVYEWGHAILYDVKSIILLFSWSSAILYVSLFLFYSQKTYNHLLVLTYFIAGVFISTVFGILDFYDHYGSLLNNNATIRFRGGSGDSNYYSMYIMIAMFSMLYAVNQTRNRFSKNLFPLLFIFFLCFGVLSLSRMFLLVVSFLSFLLLCKVLFSWKKNKKILFFILIIGAAFSLLLLNFREELVSIFDLLFSRFTDFIDDPAALTSNRNVIAEQYVGLMSSNLLAFIFGIGIQEYHIRSGILLEAHNILLELYVVWGVVGFFLFAMFIITFFRNSGGISKLVKTNLIGWLPIICMAVSYLSINAMSNESFFLLFLFAMKHIYEFD